MTRDLWASVTLPGYQGAYWARLASAPSVLHWRFAIELGDFHTTLQDALGEAGSVHLPNYVSSSGQRTSLEIPRSLGPGLYPGELKAISQWNAPIIAYRVQSMPEQEVAARELFDFAKRMKFETLISETVPRNMGLLDMLTAEYGINLAVCSSYQMTVNVVRQGSLRIGACLNNVKLAAEGVTVDQAVDGLRDRILIVELAAIGKDHGVNSAEIRSFLRSLYERHIRPSLLVLRAPDAASANELRRMVDEGLQPLIADRAGQLSRQTNREDGSNVPLEECVTCDAFASNIVSADERAAIDVALPHEPLVRPRKPRTLLVMDFNLGFPGHPSIPVHDYGLKQLGLRTGAYTAVFDNNLDNLKYPAIKRFDAIFLNNTVGLIFEDPEVRKGLVRYVREGGGLGGNHAAIYASMDWPEFAEMLGAFPSGHREPTERVWLRLDDLPSPLNAAFAGMEFAYQDEYVRFTEPPYSRDKLHILLSMDVKKTDLSQTTKPGMFDFNMGREDSDYAVSWIRMYGQGRVFYTAFGHNPTMFSTPQIASHVLAGLQFILGDLQADATPSNRAHTP